MPFRSRTEGNLTTTVQPSPRIVAMLACLLGLVTVLTLHDGVVRLPIEPFRAIGTILLGCLMLYGCYRVGRVLVRQAARDIRAFFS